MIDVHYRFATTVGAAIFLVGLSFALGFAAGYVLSGVAWIWRRS